MTDDVTRRRFIRATGVAALTALTGRSGAVRGSGTATQDAPEFSEAVRRKAKRLGHRVRKSVVKVTDAGGTGWVVSEGSVVTNSHVVSESRSHRIETFDGRTASATRVGFQPDLYPDLALLDVDLETPPPLPTSPPPDVTKGDPVVAVGHPHPVGDWVVSLGRYDRYDPLTEWIIADLPIASGSSGSPLVAMDGTIVGCVSGTTPDGGTERLDRPNAVHTSFSERTDAATAVPAETIETWVSKWR